MNSHKELTKISLETARHYQSKETGFVHYSFANEQSRETIPIFENICFALALFRTHIAEQVLEGKALLTKLLHFQSASGAFPDYLHEYPAIHRPFHNLQILFPLYQIHCHYRKILGDELKEKLIQALERLSRYIDTLPLRGLQIYQKKAFDHIFYAAERPPFPDEGLYTEKDFGKAILAAELLNDEVHVPWKLRFIGAPFKQWVKEFESKLTHLDLLLRPNIDSKDPILIHASLFYPTQIIPIEPAKVHSKDYTWLVKCSDTFHLLAIESFKPPEQPLSAGFHIFKLFFGEHNLVCQETKFAIISKITENSLIMDFNYPEDRPKEKNKLTELSFFLNHQPKIDLLIQGMKATTFSLNDPIMFDRFTLSFSLFEGDGDLFGHLYRGNRPSQTSTKVKTDHDAFDWKISLRTISRSANLGLRMKLTW